VRTIELSTLPELMFAHTFSAPQYALDMSPSPALIEVTCIREGELIHERDGVRETACAGDVTCILRDVPHRVSAAAPHRHHTVGVRAEWFASPGGLLLPTLTKACPATEAISAAIDDFIYKPWLYEHSPTRFAADFLDILRTIDRIHRQAESAPSEGALLSLRARRYIHAHLQQPIMQADVARHLGVSPQHLCRVFRQAEGMPLMSYVNRAKLTRIQTLMEKEHLRLWEAAQLYGFSDPNYVSHLYRKLFGRSITSRPTDVSRQD